MSKSNQTQFAADFAAHGGRAAGGAQASPETLSFRSIPIQNLGPKLISPDKIPSHLSLEWIDKLSYDVDRNPLA